MATVASTGPVAVPYTAPIPFPLSDGKEIIVDGVAQPYANRFNVNICAGPNFECSDTALHFNPRFDQGEVVRTHKSGGWGPEEKHGGLPFYKGTPYQLRIVVRDQLYEIFVNNNFFCVFNHRLPKEMARYLYVEGDTTVSNISFRDTRGSSFQNPPVPFTTPVQGGLHPGRSIIINGISYHGASRFNVNLMCGPYFESSDLALHFDVRFNYGNSHNTVVRTHRQGGNYGPEEAHQNYFPFVPNAAFEIMILVEPYTYKVAVNNQHFTEFKHRIQPLQRIDHLNIQGDVTLTNVRLQ